MPSHENDKKRRRRPTRESLIQKGTPAIRFELPDNALAGPAPPAPNSGGVSEDVGARSIAPSVSNPSVPTPPELGAGGLS